MTSFRTALNLASTRSALAVSFLLGLGLCWVPLLGVHGVESALVLGVVLPPFAAVIGVRIAAAFRRSALATSAMTLVGVSVSCAGLLLAIPVLLLALNSLRVSNCAPLQGLAFVLLGPGFGVVLGGLVGAVAGAGVRSAGLATAIAVAAPLSGIAVALYRFWATPAVFAYGHFFGYFQGSLYDEDVGIPPALLTLRVFTAALGCGLLSVLLGCHDSAVQRLRWRGRRSAVWLLVAVSALGCAALGEHLGTRLGHRTTSSWIGGQLYRRVHGDRCDALIPRETHRTEALRLVHECDFRLQQTEKWLGVKHKERLLAYFFRSTEEKWRLMGAARTSMAKPWRHEVYLNMQSWPHPVLGHEIAHVVAGEAGVGPFRISGWVFGLWPNTALIEGVAGAAAWGANNGMTPHQWARAMLETGLAPRLREVFGGGFLAQPKRRAYVLTASVLRFVAERYGAATVRRIYTTSDIASATKTSVQDLEQQWRRYLRRVQLPESAHALARVRFARRQSIFTLICPHTVAVLQSQLQADLAASDDRASAATCRRILSVNPDDLRTRSVLVGALARDGDLREARKELKALARLPTTPTPLLVSAEEALADAAWRRGRPNRALATYRKLVDRPLPQDMRRLLQVKILALETGGEQARLLFELLVGGDGRRADGATAVHLARELRSLRQDGLAAYLEARQLFFSQRFEAAAELAHKAGEGGLPTPEIAVEALRLEAMARYAKSQFDDAERVWRLLGADADPARRAEAEDWLARIAYARDRS